MTTERAQRKRTGGVPFWLQRLCVGRNPRVTLMRVVGWAVGATVFFRWVLLPVWVDGESMAPTYRTASFNFAQVWWYRFHDPQPGEVVVVEMTGRRAMYLKRVLAGPGDTLYFRDGVLFVNGVETPEPYVLLRGHWTTAPEQLGPDEYFIAGDNRSYDWERHAMGVVPREQIAGRILW